MLTFTQMSKGLKIECNAINTIKRKNPSCSRAMLLIYLTIQGNFDHKYVRVDPWDKGKYIREETVSLKIYCLWEQFTCWMIQKL